MKIKVENQNQDDQKQFATREIPQEEKDKTLEKLYQKDDFKTFQKPPKIYPEILIRIIIISFIFGLIFGFFISLFLIKKGIIVPF